MMTQAPYPDLGNVQMHALCLYARKDERFRGELETYLNILYQNNVLQYPRYEEIDDYATTAREVSKEVEHTDVLILLITPHFLASDFCYGVRLRQLIEEKNRKNICIVPLIFTACDLERTQLRKLERLPCNELPLVNEYTRHFEQPLLLMSRELETVVQRARYRKFQVGEAWRKATQVNEYYAYRSFEKQFPFHRHAIQAKERADQMLEEKLWKEAKSLSDIEHLFNYLREAPKQRYEIEAIDKIIEIEDSMDGAGKEALGSADPALLFDYLYRFPKGQEAHYVQGEIYEQLNDPFITDRSEAQLKTEAHELLLRAFRKLGPEELFSLDRYHRFGESVFKLAIGNLKHISNQIFSLLLMLFMLTVLFFMATVLFQRLGWSLGQVRYLLWAGGIWLGYRLFLANQYFKADRNYCTTTAKEVRRSLIRLKLAFLFHQYPKINKVLLYFLAANTRLNEIRVLTFFDYLFPRKKKAPEVKVKPKGALPPKDQEEEEDKKAAGKSKA